MLRALALILVTLVGCGARAATPTATEIALGSNVGQVELDIYSGRPNPVWALSEPDAQTLAGMIGALPAIPPAAESDPLGYRGFVVEFTDPLTGVATTLRAYGGIVRVTVDGGVSFRADPERRVERWLLDTGRSTLDSETYDLVASEVGAQQP